MKLKPRLLIPLLLFFLKVGFAQNLEDPITPVASLRCLF